MSMKSTTVKITAVLLSLVLTFSLLSGCGNTAVPASEEPAIAKDTAVFSPVVTIVADGREITIEDTAGKCVQELLDMADVILGDHDVLSLSPAQEVTDTLTIRVLRSCTVTICIPTEDPAVTQNYTMVLVGATVADALAAAGLELTDNQLCNFDLTEELTDGMEIVLSIKEEETVPEGTHSPEPTTPAPTAPAPTTPRPTSPAPTSPAPTQPATTAPTAPPTTVPPTTVPPTTAPAPTEPPRTIVSVEIYEDCDGSGHGVKVITYSDGTQEEVYF